MTKVRRKSIPNYKQLRGLKQYKDMTDEEFDDVFAERVAVITDSEDFDQRIAEKIADFEKDYDISDLKINDMMMLRTLMQSIITVEDLNRMAYDLRTDDISQDNVIVAEKINRMVTDQLKAISTIQDDLKISRKIRKGQENESVLSYIENLKRKAREFYGKKMFIVTCPKCKKWIFSGWFLFPDMNNDISLVCNSVTDDGGTCGEVVKITSKELLEKKGFSDPSLFPEAFV
jgi:hypothetical protein